MKIKKKWLLIIGIAVGVLLLEVCLMPLRAYNLKISGVTALLIFGLYTYCCLSLIQIIKPTTVVVTVFTALLVIHLPLRVIYWQDSLVTFPDAIMHLLGIIIGYLFWLCNNKIRMMVLAPLLGVFSIGYFYGSDFLLSKLNYDTWTGRVVHEEGGSPIVFKKEDGTDVLLSDFRGKYVLMDFWNTMCGNCYKSFPALEKLNVQYKNDPKVEILAVHCRYKKTG